MDTRSWSRYVFDVCMFSCIIHNTHDDSKRLFSLDNRVRSFVLRWRRSQQILRCGVCLLFICTELFLSKRDRDRRSPPKKKKIYPWTATAVTIDFSRPNCVIVLFLFVYIRRRLKVCRYGVCVRRCALEIFETRRNPHTVPIPWHRWLCVLEDHDGRASSPPGCSYKNPKTRRTRRVTSGRSTKPGKALPVGTIRPWFIINIVLLLCVLLFCYCYWCVYNHRVRRERRPNTAYFLSTVQSTRVWRTRREQLNDESRP